MGLRQMQLKDLDAIIQIENESQLHPWPKEAFIQAMCLNQHCQVYEEDNVIQGYGVADRGHGRTIAATTMKAASTMYKAWQDYAKALGVPELYAEIEATNDAARARLERYGFQRIGTRPSFYGPGIDAEVWAKSTEPQAA